ncbi:DUF5667 domain-containing protein [Phaeacidiphilus oryzae]|uniref:DUF5667 domain-containing protein n=1 Tax=Phaeacidiphilus oryzae TaxID=348818 RepID=UPI00055EBD33|nr:DUF5667 domain-containing protein [Phaeacidiphilus oryzae]
MTGRVLEVLEHRRAKAFAEALEAVEPTADQPAPHGAENSAGAELGGLLEAVGALRALPVPELAGDVRMVQRAHLVAAFENMLAEQPSSAAAVPAQQSRHGTHRAPGALGLFGGGRLLPASRWRRRLAFGGLAAGMAVGALGGVAAASSNALPGDALYGMKRSLEDWRLGLAGSDAERGRLLLDQASARMGEVQQLMGARRGGELSPELAARIRSEFDEMNADGTRGRDLLRGIYLREHTVAPMRRLAGFAAQEQPRLDTVSSQLPHGLAPVTEPVRRLLSGIDREVAPLHLTGPTVGGSGSSPAMRHSAPAGSRAPSAAPGGGLLGGATTTGTGGGSSHGSATPTASQSGGVGGIVGGLTGGVLGNGGSSSRSSSSPSGPTTSGTGSSPAASPSSSGLNLPPLVPGLLPGLGLSG